MRRARKFLSVLGALFILIALYLQFESAGALDYVALGLGALGVVLVGLSMSASDRAASAVQALLTGWP